MPDTTLGMRYTEASQATVNQLFSLTPTEAQKARAKIALHESVLRTQATAANRARHIINLDQPGFDQPASERARRIYDVNGEYYLAETKHKDGKVGEGRDGTQIFYAVKLDDLLNSETATQLYTLKRTPATKQSIALSKHYAENTAAINNSLDRPSDWGVTTSKDQRGITHYGVLQTAPYIAGTDLFDFIATHIVIDSPKLNFNQALKLVLAIARALEDFHAKGYVHRDIKLENLVVRFDESLNDFEVDIIDMEFVVAEGHDTDTPVGTPEYVAPEILLIPHNTASAAALSSYACTGKADVYAFGIIAGIIFEAENTHPTNEDFATFFLDEEHSMYPGNESLAQALQIYLKQATAVDPEQRSSAADFTAQLSKLLASIEATEAAAATVTTDASSDAASDSTSAATPPPVSDEDVPEETPAQATARAAAEAVAKLEAEEADLGFGENSRDNSQPASPARTAARITFGAVISPSPSPASSPTRKRPAPKAETDPQASPKAPLASIFTGRAPTGEAARKRGRARPKKPLPQISGQGSLTPFFSPQQQQTTPAVLASATASPQP